ncbi:hypothetical protein HDU98_002296 [Podochytrium sp. JEL0797]|nr:hypothetical protein HDU98_002296 [Podochytrium sp. JEL0797]
MDEYERLMQLIRDRKRRYGGISSSDKPKAKRARVENEDDKESRAVVTKRLASAAKKLTKTIDRVTPQLMFWGGERIKLLVASGIKHVNTSTRMIDSGASVTMSPEKSMFVPGSLQSVFDEFVVLADDNTTIPVEEKGIIRYEYAPGVYDEQPGGLYVPQLAETLISISHMLKDTDNVVSFSADTVYIWISKLDKVIEIGQRKGGLYYFKVNPQCGNDEVANAVRRNKSRRPTKRVSYLEWHVRMGHLGLDLLCKTLDAFGISYDFSNDETDCPTCQIINFRKLTTRAIAPKAKRFLWVIGEDIFECPGIQWNAHLGMW